jgi:hypothetical protein
MHSYSSNRTALLFPKMIPLRVFHNEPDAGGCGCDVIFGFSGGTCPIMVSGRMDRLASLMQSLAWCDALRHDQAHFRQRDAK